MKKELLGIVIILAMLSLFFQPSVTGFITRSISNTQDNKDTMICNSNGKCWEAIGDNLQLAVDDLNQGGKVFLPPGVFNIDNLDNDANPGSQVALLLDNNIALIGSGSGATIIETTETNIYPIWISNKHNITLSDFTVEMHNNGGNAINIQLNSSNIQLKNIKITNPGANGIRAHESKRLLMSNILVDHVQWPDGGRQGFSISTVEDSMWTNCMVTNCDDAMGFDMSRSTNCQVNNLIVDNCTYAMKVVGVPGAETKNASFNNINLLGHTEGAGLKIQYTENSNFNNILIKSGNGGTGLSIYSTCKNLNFNNVQLEESSGEGFYIGGEGMNVNNVIVNNPVS